MRAQRPPLRLGLVVLLVSCGGGTAGGPAPGLAGARPSGQSHLMDDTFAGQHRCSPETHDRPFVIEWDATDASSFQARASNDVVFVKYAGCNLTIIDSCSDDSVRGAFGSYKPVDWTSGAVEKVDVDNLVDLYAKLPLGVALLGGRVESGEKFHMEYFVSGTRSATRPVVYESDVAKVPGCAGVTHFVYAYNLGAFALGSRANLEGHAGATVWGAGAGGDAKYASAVEKKGGELAACTGASARELDNCKVPIRLTLRAIEPGENPDRAAARAPETPDALNLAGKVQATNDRERKANEHLAAAQTKMRAGDGKGCLAELDEHDRLDPRPEGLSTSAKSGGLMTRAACVMLSGQCAAGRALTRKALEASGSTMKAEDVDRFVDARAADSCRGGAMTERDQLLRALRVLGAHDERQSVADCRKAYDTATRVVDRVPARDNTDAVYDARHAIKMNAPACFARAGDCVTAWRAAKDQDEAYARARSSVSNDETKRGAFMSATGALCVDKDQGPLSDAETVFRAIGELKEARAANAPTAAYCATRVAAGKAALPAALSGPHGADLKYEPGHLADAGAECFATANDCASAWKRYSDLRHAFGTEKKDEIERSIRSGFRNAARACNFKPQGTMTPNETIHWAAGVLEDGSRTRVEARVCTAAYEAAERAAPTFVGEKKVNSEWHYATRSIPEQYARCVFKASDCGAAWTAFRRAYPRFAYEPESDPAKVRRSFESDVSDCKAQTPSP